MGLLNKKPDALSDKARALNDRIAALEAEIKKLDTQIARAPEPKSRSAVPDRQTGATYSEKKVPPSRPSEPVFEPVNQAKLASREEPQAPELFNELGLRKYDLPALLTRWRNHFRAPTTSNPRLVNYLAAGGVQGLRPLRYEKRVARNRFFALVIIVTLVLLGLFLILKR